MTGKDRVPPTLAHALGARGFTELTDVQVAIRDLEDTNADLLVSARTGSGKTLAIGLALAPHLLNAAGRTPPGAGSLRALVLVPTRELAAQVRKEFAWLYSETGARIGICVGGGDLAAELAALASGLDAVVATPGRLRAHLRRGSVDPRGIACVVLDEADELLAQGFREELDAIVQALPAARRTLMFSATVTAAVEALAATYQTEALRIEVAAGPVAPVTYRGLIVPPVERDRVLGNLLCLIDPARALVFCGRRDGVAPLTAYLASRGFTAVGLSGDLGQTARDAAIGALRAGQARICVATDLAARGLDLPGLDLVVHADPPLTRDAMVHRSGRTGRAGRAGEVALLVPPGRRRRMEWLLGGIDRAIAWESEPDAKRVVERENARLLASLESSSDLPEDPALDAIIRSKDTARLASAIRRIWMTHRPHFAKVTEPPNKTTSLAPSFNECAEKRRDHIWFSLNRGTGSQSDVKSLLPLICRLGCAKRADIGRVRVLEGETRFEVRPNAVAGFLAATGRDLGGFILRRLNDG